MLISLRSSSAGLDAVEANVLTERWLGFALGEYSATARVRGGRVGGRGGRLQARGWMEGNDLTDSGRAARAAIEAATDAGQQALVDACGADLDGIVTMAADISTRLIEARAFPADPAQARRAGRVALRTSGCSASAPRSQRCCRSCPSASAQRRTSSSHWSSAGRVHRTRLPAQVGPTVTVMVRSELLSATAEFANDATPVFKVM